MSAESKSITMQSMLENEVADMLSALQINWVFHRKFANVIRIYLLDRTYIDGPANQIGVMVLHFEPDYWTYRLPDTPDKESHQIRYTNNRAGLRTLRGYAEMVKRKGTLVA